MHNVLEAVNRSNQRGGRMLSVVDLVEAGTLSVNQTAWILERVLHGSSWLVGARPGGAGKTTVMSAILAMVPGGTRVRLTNRGSGWSECPPGGCVVAYELSPGFYDAYVWGADVARLTELGLAGCRIVSNLHADTLEQAREQIVSECGASERGFRAFDTFIPLALDHSRRGYTPTVRHIDYVCEARWCRLERGELERPNVAEARWISAALRIAAFLKRCISSNLRLIEDVREAWLDWCARSDPPP